MYTKIITEKFNFFFSLIVKTLVYPGKGQNKLELFQPKVIKDDLYKNIKYFDSMFKFLNNVK